MKGKILDDKLHSTAVILQEIILHHFAGFGGIYLNMPASWTTLQMAAIKGSSAWF